MLSKVQKIWLWIFGAMFVVPEVLFFTTPMLIRAIYGESFYNLSSFIVNYRIFFSYPFYLLTIISIEILGVFGSLIISIRSNKKIISILLGIILFWLLFIFLLVYATSGG